MGNNVRASTLVYSPVFSLNMWMKLSLLVALFFITYFGALSLLVSTWLSRDDYSHGFLVPFISLYFIWADKESLKKIAIQPYLPGGLIVMLIGCLMLLAGSVSSVATIQKLSVIVVIPGLVLMLLGTRYLKALTLPLSYLILMVPVLDLVIERIHWPFQLFSATMSSKLLTLLSIPVFQNVNFLEFPNLTIEVAEACSGLNYMVSIIAITIPLAYFTQRVMWCRVLLLVLAFLIAILVNILRVTLIGVWSYMGGEVVHGPLHIFQGLFVSVVGFAIIFTIAWIFSEIPHANKNVTVAKPQNTANDIKFDTGRFNVAWVTAMLVLVSFAGFIYLHNPEPVALKKSLKDFPFTIGKWKEVETGYYKNYSIRPPGADSEITRVYRNSSARDILFYSGYYKSQDQDKEMDDYRLSKLYKKSTEVEIPLSGEDHIRVNKTIFEEDSHKFLALYWYDLNGRIIADRFKAKLLTTFDGLIHRRTNGAVFIVVSRLNSPDDITQLFRDEIDFVQELFPVLESFLPRDGRETGSGYLR